MKNMMKRLLLIALVSGMNSGPVMATDVATQPAEQIGGLKKVGDTIATNARKAWGGIKRAGSAVKEQLGRKHLKRNALITLLVAALTAAAAARTAHNNRGLDSVQMGKQGRWARGAGRLFRGGDDTRRGHWFGHRAGTTADRKSVV